MLPRVLREQVLAANLDLGRRGLALSIFGNASGVHRAEGLLVSKSSGVPYEGMKAEDLAVSDLEGQLVDGARLPSADLAAPAALYRAFSTVGGTAHSHSEHARALGQARRSIPYFGTIHADYFQGSVPVTEGMTEEEINDDYEANTGTVIIRTFERINPVAVRAVLETNPGPFAWALLLGKRRRMQGCVRQRLELRTRRQGLTRKRNQLVPGCRIVHSLRNMGKG